MGLRILRMPVQVFSLAAGDSKNGMYVGIVRASSLVPSLYFAMNGYEIIIILAIGIIGELLGLVLGSHLAKSVAPLSWNVLIVVFSFIWLLGVSLFSYWATDRYGIHPLAAFIMQFILLFLPFFLIFRSKFTMDFIHILKRV